MKKTPWQKIRDAGEKGTGTRLTAEDVGHLCSDGAIMTRAEMDDANAEGIPDSELL